MLMPAGKFFTMFHFLEYPFSRGSTHIVSPNPYEAPDFDAGFMNDKRDMAPMVWGYIKSRETARRMDAYAGEVQAMHPFYAYNSPARANDMDLATTNAVSNTQIINGILLTQAVRSAWKPYCRHPARILEHASQTRPRPRTQLPQLKLTTCTRRSSIL
jgi:hypothetical protein